MNKSNFVLIVILISFLVSGIVEGIFSFSISDQQAITVAHSIFIAVCVFIWCGRHAKENELRKIGGYKVFCAVFPIIGVPVYFFRFFGFKSGTVKTGKALFYLLLIVIVIALPIIFIPKLIG
ncbi:hypothetical protein [Alkalimarinus alittae]|uniref:Uncharacterized protein n=1 Tax=Alkalimarinus alittae TaxID=2961619 RepID=A0ABY6N517_9ALTE|nr:hypothetical protein [Alkalimarinus alittae]UZE97181.1 hypothetical protein NKI27_05380 [Alkalimarinus alittae]UZE97206.1 hypothetical protein NKI27_05510 [Alkalimarinus alittae]